MQADDVFILHVDGDNFFASCEIARLPHLQGTPVVVGEERGIACAMNKEAKALGVTRGMPIFHIRRSMPQVTILPSHFDLYRAYCQKLQSILRKELTMVEGYSIDECFAEVPASLVKETQPEEWLKKLKRRVQVSLGITYSFGLAHTKVLAKIASKREKPNGCTVLLRNEEAILKQTPIETLWGVGRALCKTFARLRVKTAYDFFNWDEERVAGHFSRPVQELWHELHGRKMFKVGDDTRLPKSLQSTRSFPRASSNLPFIIAELLHNLDVAFSRMRSYGLATKQISIFIKTDLRRYYRTSIQLSDYTCDLTHVSSRIAALVVTLFQRTIRYKATGVTLYHLTPLDHLQEDLFGVRKELHAGKRVMDTVDTIRKKYGTQSIALTSVLLSLKSRESLSKERKQKEVYLEGLPFPFLGEVE